eukprot:1939312-Rhodomonas_salina.1
MRARARERERETERERESETDRQTESTKTNKNTKDEREREDTATRCWDASLREDMLLRPCNTSCTRHEIPPEEGRRMEEG